MSDSDNVAINIAAVNDEQVPSTNTGRTVNENSTNNVINNTQLSTTDVDNTSSQLVYTITAGTSNGTLRKSGTALAVSSTFTQADIDSRLITYDHNGSETSSDSFAFSVNDGTGSASTGTFSLTISAVNDNAPVITSNGGGASATVNVAEGVTAVTTVVATDADLPAQTLTYSIVGGADLSLFSISSTTGVLSFVTGLDFETPIDVGANNVYDLIIRVEDGGNWDDQSVAVTITNVNEVPTFSVGNGPHTSRRSLACSSAMLSLSRRMASMFWSDGVTLVALVTLRWLDTTTMARSIQRLAAVVATS